MVKTTLLVVAVLAIYAIGKVLVIRAIAPATAMGDANIKCTAGHVLIVTHNSRNPMACIRGYYP